MKDTETVLLTRYVKACCPQQHFDSYTPDAWHKLLGDLQFADCEAAVTELAKSQPFIAPCDIRAEVKRVREARITAADIPPPPPELTSDRDAYSAALHAARIAAADGRDPEAAMHLAAAQTRRGIEAPRD
jgi:hypothetical protein